jgi:hypothetical protein
MMTQEPSAAAASPSAPNPVEDIQRVQDEAAEQERRRARKARRSDFIVKATATLAIVSGALIFAAILYWEIMGGAPRFMLSGHNRDILRRLDNLEQEIEQVAESAAQQEALLRAITNAADDADANLQLAEIKARLDAFSERINQYDAAIVEDPTKALSMPLLRRDVENLTEALNATRNEVDRVYDQNKWFIGLVVTMTISVVGLAIGSLYETK